MRHSLRTFPIVNGLLISLFLISAGPALTQPSPTREQALSKRKDFYKINLTAGLDLVSYPSSLNKEWVNDSLGLGMRQNLGFSLRFDYRFIPSLAVSVTAGYTGWEIVRRYTLNGADQYQETQRLNRIPLQLGLKVYLFKGLYVMPEAGVSLMASSVKTSDGHPTPTNTSAHTTPISYGGNVGYEFYVGRVLFDLSGRYQILQVDKLGLSTQNTSLSGQVQSGGVRLGVGFSSEKK